MRGKRIQTFYKEMYNLMKQEDISNVILNTYPDSLKDGGETYVVVELPYSLRNIDISDFDVMNSYAKFSFFAKDRILNTTRVPNIIPLEDMIDKFRGLFPFKGDGYSLMTPRVVILPKKADAHYHYAVVNVPIVFH